MKRAFLYSIAFAVSSTAQYVHAERCAIPDLPKYCYVIGKETDCASMLPAKLNKKGKLCHPPESPYYSFVRVKDDEMKTLEDCSSKQYDLPDVLLRVCTATPARREEALDMVEAERESVKSFQQKTHLAAGLQLTDSSVRPTAIIHTVVGKLPSARNAPELYAWVWGPFVAVSPDIKFSLDDNDQSTTSTPASPASSDGGDTTPMESDGGNESTGPTIGIGLLISRRPSFDKRGFSLGVGYWKSNDDEGIQFVVSTNMTSFP